MSDKGDQPATGDEAIELAPWGRWVSAALGLAGVAAGGAAVFLTHVEAGPVALIAGGVLFLFMALGGVLPTHLRFGQTEAKFLREVKESRIRVEQTAPEVGTLLDAGGASVARLLAGDIPVPNEDLLQAGVVVGSLQENVDLIEAKAGLEAVPAQALLALSRWHMTRSDWVQAARYLDAYVSLSEASWEDYFTLGVAHMNTRGGPQTDRRALRAYDEAIARLPASPPLDLTARLYSYRAAAKKRLHRLDEARADAEIARRLAESEYEHIDATYNLAGIEAMLGNHDAAMRHITELAQLGAADLVLGHLDDYFSSLREDDEFRRVVGLTPSSRGQQG